MKKIKIIAFVALLAGGFLMESCGPIIISSRPSHPMPSWFYPNRVVNVRYVYFPDVMIYYDISHRNYLYFENNIWISVDVLPPRYNSFNLHRARQIRVNDYYGDNIRDYHFKRTATIRGRRQN